MTPEAVEIKFYITQLKAVSPDPPEVKTIPLSDKQLWLKYKRLVWKITEKQPIKRLDNFDKRGFKGYHLDHKVSIWYGYKNKIDPQINWIY